MVSSTLECIDLTDLDVFAERMPHDWFDLLRREAPVWRHPGGADEPFWVVSTYASSPKFIASGLAYSHQTGPGRNGAGGICSRCPR